MIVVELTDEEKNQKYVQRADADNLSMRRTVLRGRNGAANVFRTTRRRIHTS